MVLMSCHVGRYFIYNFANITDYKKFRNVEIAASAKPFEFSYGQSEINIQASQNISSQRDLDDLNADNKSVAFLIIRGDSIYYEWYDEKLDSSSMLTSFSMAKSYVSALIGIAINEGYIESVHDPITKYIDNFKNDGFEAITIEHLLNMRTGIDYEENYYSPFGNVAIGYYGRNLDRHISKLKVKEKPNVRMEYISIATQLLGVIIEESTGQSLSAYCEEKLWKKIGTTYGASWSLDRKGGREKAFCCLNARARDYAKFGRLYLNNGVWDGEQVVPKAWVEKSTNVDENYKDAYAYQWWLNPIYDKSNSLISKTDFYMQGHLGQFVYMVPDKDLIFVRLGENYGNVSWVSLFMRLSRNID